MTSRLRQMLCRHPDTESEWVWLGDAWTRSYWLCFRCGRSHGEKGMGQENYAVFPGGLEAAEPVDLGVVTHVCICGSSEWKVVVSFDDYEVATLSTEMYCRWCGAKAVTPTPLDRPDPDRQD